MLLLTAADVAALLPWHACIAAVEGAFAASGTQPFSAIGMGGFHVKAGLLGRYFAAKVNGNFPANRGRGLPTIQGVVVLCDADNGTPLAIMDSGEITRRRTAAATAVAARWLALPEASSVTIIGCGAQAPAQLEALRVVRQIRRVACRDIDPAQAARLAEECAGWGLAPAEGATDIIITCTTAREPVLRARDVRPGTFVAAVGADHPEKREIAADLMAAARIVADVREQAQAFGELHHAPQCASVDLGQVIAGRAPGRAAREEIVLFDSTGMALQDVAGAAVVYEAAVRL